jgi:uncharacterized membrane protein
MLLKPLIAFFETMENALKYGSLTNFVMEVRIDFSNRKAIAGIVVLLALLALVFYLPNIISESNPDVCFVDGVCQHEARVMFLTDLIPIGVLAGIMIGALVFFFMTSKLESKEKSLKTNSAVLLSFLSQDEKKLVNALIENNGRVLQAEVTRLPGMTKVKSHRVVQRLIDRGVIEKDRVGKTNVVRFTRHIREGLL